MAQILVFLVIVCVVSAALGAAYGRWLTGMPTSLPALVVIVMFWLFQNRGSIAAGLALGALAGQRLYGPLGVVLGSLVGLHLGILLDNHWSLKVSEKIDRWFLEPFFRVFWARGNLPIRLDDFLNYATEAMLIKRVGDGYEFIHRLLRDHLAVGHLILQLRDRKGNIDLSVVEQVSRLGESSLEVLKQLVRHPDHHVRAAAVRGFGQLSTPRVAEILLECFVAEENPEHRADLVDFGSWKPGWHRELQGLLRSALKDPSPAVRVMAIRTQSAWGKAQFVQYDALNDQDAEVIRETVMLFGRGIFRGLNHNIGEQGMVLPPGLQAVPDLPRLCRVLVELLGDHDAEVRAGAAFLVGAAGDYRSLPFLAKICSSDGSPKVRAVALRSVNRLTQDKLYP